MKNLTKSIVITSLFFISTSCIASTMIGGGANSCSYFLQTLQSNNQYVLIWRQWITGFISGRNYERDESKGRNIDEDAFVYEVRNYCQKEPMKKIYEAVIFLYESKL